MKIRDLIPWNRENDYGISKYEPDAPFYALQREMNRMFDSFSRSFFDDAFFSRENGIAQTVAPRVNVAETDNEIEVTAELPGMDEKDVEVNFSRNTLVIRGEKKAEKEDKKKGYRLVERSYGSFYRAIAVPPGVDPEKIEAKFKNGVLKVTLLKTKEAQHEMKKIAVKCE